MAAEAEAAREARAKVSVQTVPCSPHCPYLQVIAADGEQKAARALKEASETIAESSSAMQLRYLQVRH